MNSYAEKQVLEIERQIKHAWEDLQDILNEPHDDVDLDKNERSYLNDICSDLEECYNRLFNI